MGDIIYGLPLKQIKKSVLVLDHFKLKYFGFMLWSMLVIDIAQDIFCNKFKVFRTWK